MIHSFPQSWQDKVSQLNFQHFTPIQEKAFSPIFQGKNLAGISPTGTGKTLAYIWPILLKLKSSKAQQVLILAPNSELAGQIFEVVKDWAQPLNWTAQVLLSGSSQKRQIERLKKGPQILVGTPGRVLELVRLKKIKMMALDTIVLDEFDQLFEKGQYQFVSQIIKHAPKDHQMIYMSATDKFDPELLNSDTELLDLRTDQDLTNISHFYLQTAKRDKAEILRKLANIPDFRALVFFNSLSDLGANEEKLIFRKAAAFSLASDVNIKYRKTILEKFKNHEVSLLLATDLLARGIDIDQLECVINFELPRDAESYTHRSGRTGRMGKEGFVITLVSHPEEIKALKKLAPVQEVILKNQAFYTV